MSFLLFLKVPAKEVVVVGCVVVVVGWVVVVVSATFSETEQTMLLKEGEVDNQR